MYDFKKNGPFVKKYYDSLEEGKIMSLRCTACGNHQWPPMPICQKCGRCDTEWVELSGDAVIDEVAVVLGSFLEYNEKFKEYKGYRSCCGHLKEGPEFNNILFGLPKELSYDDVNKMLPLEAKAEIIQLEGCKTVAFRVKK